MSKQQFGIATGLGGAVAGMGAYSDSVWAACDFDRGGIALFDSEVAALRYALAHGLSVVKRVALPCLNFREALREP